MTDVTGDLRHAARDQWPGYDWASAEARTGAFHVVLIPADGDVVLRATTGYAAGERGDREYGIMRTLSAAGLPVAVPELRSAVISSEIWSAFLISRLPGCPLDATAFDEVPIEDYRRIQSKFLFVDRDRLRELPVPRLVRWWGVAAACLGDRAIDIAPLIGFHGAAALRRLAAPSLLRRAMIHRATLSLQVAAAAHLVGATDLRDHALGNFVTRNSQGTLYDPHGLRPDDLPPV